MQKLTITSETGNFTALFNVPTQMKISDFKNSLEEFFNLKITEILLNGKSIMNQLKIQNLSICVNDILIAKFITPISYINILKYIPKYKSLSELPKIVLSKKTLYRECIRLNNSLRLELLNKNPKLLESLLPSVGNNLTQIKYNKQKDYNNYNIENQKHIENIIKSQNINDNMANAIEHLPESFAKVEMLYVPCEINKKKLIAFVDSGAQSTVMSLECVKKLDLTYLVDYRWSGLAQGVGTAKIIGKIHLAQIRVGENNLNCSFTVINQSEISFLFGLDMLKRHQMIINLAKNTLIINEDSIPFLSEREIKKYKQEKMSETSKNYSDITKEEDINKLELMGFTRDKAIDALKKNNGNVEKAASYLISLLK